MDKETREMEKERRKVLLRSFFLRMMRGKLRVGLRTWYHRTLSLQNMDNKRKRAAAKWQRTELHRAFSRWRNVLVENDALQKIGRKVIERMQHRLLHRSIGSWRRRTEERRCLRGKMKRTCARWKEKNLMIGMI